MQKGNFYLQKQRNASTSVHNVVSLLTFFQGSKENILCRCFFVPLVTFLKAYSLALKSNLVLLAWLHSAIHEEKMSIHQSFLAIFDLGAMAIKGICCLYSAVVGVMLSFSRDLGFLSLDKIILANYFKCI